MKNRISKKACLIAVCVIGTCIAGCAISHDLQQVEKPQIQAEEALCIVSLSPTPHEEEQVVEELYLHDIPAEYSRSGGSFSKETQAYTYSLCKETGIDYFIVVALIERESGYRASAAGDNGNSRGYMQIYKKWHIERMEKLGVSDLFDPYSNVSVGVDFLGELYEKYGDPTKVLMAYNMGESGAKRCWDKGMCETEYSKGILKRAQEIKQDIQDQ